MKTYLSLSALNNLTKLIKMKKTILTIILTIIAIAAVLFISHAIWGDGECIFSGDDNTECSSAEKKACCDKELEKKACCDKAHKEDSHHAMMAQLIPLRAEFENQLSDEEKAMIEAIEENFEAEEMEGHEDLCPEGMAKFNEAHKEDIAALLAIANNHQEFFDNMMAKMHETKKCEPADGEVKKEACPEAAKCKEATEKCKGEQEKPAEEAVKKDACPEAAKCKEATEKCKGENEKTEAEAQKCKEAEAKCKASEAECKTKCMDTFKVHFLLLDDDFEGDDDDDGEEDDD
jgi:hypothetical protein